MQFVMPLQIYDGKLYVCVVFMPEQNAKWQDGFAERLKNTFWARIQHPTEFG